MWTQYKETHLAMQTVSVTLCVLYIHEIVYNFNSKVYCISFTCTARLQSTMPLLYEM